MFVYKQEPGGEPVLQTPALNWPPNNRAYDITAVGNAGRYGSYAFFAGGG